MHGSQKNYRHLFQLKEIKFKDVLLFLFMIFICSTALARGNYCQTVALNSHISLCCLHQKVLCKILIDTQSDQFSLLSVTWSKDWRHFPSLTFSKSDVTKEKTNLNSSSEHQLAPTSDFPPRYSAEQTILPVKQSSD